MPSLVVGRSWFQNLHISPKTKMFMKFGLAVSYKIQKTGVARKQFVSHTFLIKCQGQIEAMGNRIISCFCEKQQNGVAMYFTIDS